MRRLITYEASLLSFFGALCGVASASILGKIVEVILNILDRHRGITHTYHFFAFPLWGIILCVLFMMGVGLLVVQFPAKRAETINPILALRRE